MPCISWAATWMSIWSVIIRNRRTYKGPGVYVGRPSPLGNPYREGSDGTREEVIEKYRYWLWSRLSKPGVIGDAKIMRMMASLNEDSILICWCAPLPCHASVIIDAWQWLRSEGLV